MARPQRTVIPLSASITGNVADQELIQPNGRGLGGSGIEAGGRIVLGTATTAEVLVKDGMGKVLHSAASPVIANVDIDPISHGIKGPLTVTVTNISNSAHTLTVYWSVKK